MAGCACGAATRGLVSDPLSREPPTIAPAEHTKDTEHTFVRLPEKKNGRCVRDEPAVPTRNEPLERPRSPLSAAPAKQEKQKQHWDRNAE
jgi:hypothetical protein